MEAPALYKCPYCPKTFMSKTEGWSNATQHIRMKHPNRGSGRHIPFSESKLRDNLFGDVGVSSQGHTFG